MTPWRAFVPLPRPGISFWNTNLLDPWPGLEALAGLLVLAGGPGPSLAPEGGPGGLRIGGAGLLAFGYLKLVGELRHQGHWWLLFAAALWLGGGLPEDRGSWRSRVFLVLLIVHCGVGLYASAMDLRHPFSNGAATAELIRDRGTGPVSAVRPSRAAGGYGGAPLGRPLYRRRGSCSPRIPTGDPEQRELGAPGGPLRRPRAVPKGGEESCWS